MGVSGGRGDCLGLGAHLTDTGLSLGLKPGSRLARVTFVARVHSLCQQHAAQLALRTLPLEHLGQVGRHAEREVVDLALVVFADTAEEGGRRGPGLGQKDSSSVAGYLSPSSGCCVSASFGYYTDVHRAEPGGSLGPSPRPSRACSLGL